mgnify:CR=1 FL=1
MSRLDELIQELCPDGVEYKTVGALANISRGRVMSKNYIAENAGEYPVYSSQTENDGELGKISTYDFEGEYLTWTTDGANAGSVFYRNGKFSVTNVCGLINCNDDEILTRYMYHYLSKNAKSYVSSGMGNPKLMSNVMARIKVAVPPLEVQREIVCILDSFTLRTAELAAELTAELTARKKQYQYYLNHYFESQLDNLVSLDSLGTLTRGKRFVHADAIGQGVPCIHYGELYTYYGVYANNVKSYIREELRPKMRYAHKGDVIIVGAGENNIDIGIGVAWEGDEDVAVHDACYILRHSQNSKYISYFLRSDMYHNQIKKYVSEGKICSISAKGLGKAMIPLPSIAEQQKIVEILDRFDALCNDLTSGLPAEINARQKQYEYYRDKLLSFK